MASFLIFLHLYLLSYPSDKTLENANIHLFYVWNWETMEKITHLGSQHFSIPVMLILPVFCPFLFNDTSERLHSFWSSSHLSQRCSQLMTSPLSSQANRSTGNFLNLPSPDHHGDLYLHPCPSCVLSLLLILPLHSQTSQTDVHMFSLHLRNCSLILDPFQTAFCPLCDTSTALGWVDERPPCGHSSVLILFPG